MNKINWREPHEYAETPCDGEDILCSCGLPEDNPLHIKSVTKEYEDGVSTYTDIDKQVEKWFKTQLGTAGDIQKLKNLFHLIYTKAKAEQREEDINSVMYLIDGNYDNPNLAGDIEETFGITFQEWCKNE